MTIVIFIGHFHLNGTKTMLTERAKFNLTEDEFLSTLALTKEGKKIVNKAPVGAAPTPWGWKERE